MGMTMTEKILAAHAGLAKVSPGDLINVRLDLVMSSDATFPVSLNEYRRFGFNGVFDPKKVVLVMDHFTPSKDIRAAENCRLSREFAGEVGLGSNFYDVGRMGVEHALLPEQGFVAPGELIIGGDSHTCTYGALGAFATGVGSTDVCGGMVSGEAWLKVPASIRLKLTGKPRPWVTGKDVILYIIHKIGVSGALYQAMEYCGDGLRHLTIDDRFTIANMAIEAGAKNGIFPVDDITREYLAGRVDRDYTVYCADSDAAYAREVEIDLSAIENMVAFPHLPGNGKPVSEAAGIRIDSVLIGSCTNARLSDLEYAARVLRGRKVSDSVRTLVIPATQEVYRQALDRGLISVFLDANCAVGTPGCAACGGGHMGLIGKGERILSTSNRNFVGRMGHIDSEIYLASPAVAAASAVAGTIIGPGELGL